MSGLRERKKAETRRRIEATAVRLFAARGFEAVTVNEIAEAAGVAKATLFSYFPSKESMALQGVANDDLATVVTTRPPDTTPLQALRTHFLARVSDNPGASPRAGAAIGAGGSPEAHRGDEGGPEAETHPEAAADPEARSEAAADPDAEAGPKTHAAADPGPAADPEAPAAPGAEDPRRAAAGDIVARMRVIFESPTLTAAAGALLHRRRAALAEALGETYGEPAATLAAAQITATVVALQETFFHLLEAGATRQEAGATLAEHTTVAFDQLAHGIDPPGGSTPR